MEQNSHKEILWQLKERVLNQNISPEEFEKELEKLEAFFSHSFALLDFLLNLLSYKNLDKPFKILILKKVFYIYKNNFEFSKALQTGNLLTLLINDPEIKKEIAQIQKILPLERLKDIFKKYNFSLDRVYELFRESIHAAASPEYLLIKRHNIPKEEILQAIKNFYKIPVFSFEDRKNLIPLPAIKNIIHREKDFFIKRLTVPFKFSNKIFFITYYPEKEETLREVAEKINIHSFEKAFALREDILEFIAFYGVSEDFSLQMAEEEEEPLEDISEIEDNVVVALVNSIIEDAYRQRASDIHWESFPGKKGLRVRFRIDGECIDYTLIPPNQRRAIISRIKIMANLNIAERRLPQDGKIKFKLKTGETFEIRIAVIPTAEGEEDVVMRILGGIEFRSLEEIDLLPENYEKFKKLLDYPYGLILVVGPTGSGKTTTLHAALKYLNRPEKKIWTAEDPVEIVQDGLRQVQVNPKIGLTFSRVLRAFLRADPDIIMIGETRDVETAHILVEASLTGHLVLSTLHTNSAPETIVRFLTMDVDPFNFGDSLLGILAQRLAKRLCPKCKEKYTPSEEEIKLIFKEYGDHPVKPLTEEMIKNATFYRPKGCDFCNYKGFKGRIALHELLIADEDIKKLIIEKAPASKIRETAIPKGFLSLKQDGILKVLKGETTLKEIKKVTMI